MSKFGEQKEMMKKRPQQKQQISGESLQQNAINHHMRGDLINAEKAYRQAIKTGYYHDSIFVNLGVICASSGRLDEAILLYKKVIETSPSQADAYINLGNLYHRINNFEEALIFSSKGFELKPDNHDALITMGSSYRHLGNLDQALTSTLKSLELKPDNPYGHMNLGNIYQDLGNLDQALASTLKSLELKPDNPTALMNLGSIYRNLGKLDQALNSTLKSLELKPDNPFAHMNLGNIYQDLGKPDQALTSTLKSLELKHDNPTAHMNLGGIFKGLGKLDQALTSTLKSLELKPDNPTGYIKLGGIYKDLGNVDQALATYQKGSVIAPANSELYTAVNLALQDIYADAQHIQNARSNYKSGIKRIAHNQTVLDIPKGAVITDMFWLAYHNMSDDKEILETLGMTMQALYKTTKAGSWQLKAWKDSRVEKVRVGICSDLLRFHTIGKLYIGIIQKLNHSGIDITILRGPGAKSDEFSQKLDAYAGNSIRLPASPKEAAKVIKKEGFDALFYPDIGMSPYTYILALDRLAPIQATSWGHPNTTGLNTIDYFISSELIEPANAQELYTEQLVEFRKLPCIYAEPKLETKVRFSSKLQLPDDRILIGIPQSLFKFHPDYDDVLERIIDKLPDTNYVIIEGTNKAQTERLKQRWSSRAPETLKKTIFLKRMSQKDYLCLLDTLNILLDPIYFGSGNTFYEAMAMGSPLVTMPGNHMRSRIVAGGYKQMKLKNPPVASNIQEYIDLTIELAKNAEIRVQLKEEIRTAAQKYLFNDQEAANEIVEFFQAAIEEYRKTGGLLPVGWKPSLK